MVWFLCQKTQQKILLAEVPKTTLSYEQQCCGLTFEVIPWCKTLVIILFTSIGSNQSATIWTINNICRKLIAGTRMSNIMGSCAHQQCIPQHVSKMPHGLRVSIRLSNLINSPTELRFLHFKTGRCLFGHWALKAAQSSRAFEEMITPKLKEAVVSRGIPDLPDKIHLHGREKRSAFLQDHVNLRGLPSRCSRTKLKCTHCAAIIKSVPKCWMYHCSSVLYNHSPDHTISLDFRKEWRSLWRGNIHKPQHNHDHNH